MKDGDSTRLTKYIMKKSIEPVTNATWLALERELRVAASLTIRRRLRNKTTIRSISGVIEEGEEELDKAAKIRGVRMLEEEAEMMIMDDPEAVAREAGILQRMKKAVTEWHLYGPKEMTHKRRGVQHRVPPFDLVVGLNSHWT